MSNTILKTGELGLDLQGQIGLETQKFCVIPSECYGSLCNKLITIVNYYLESGLFCIVW